MIATEISSIRGKTQEEKSFYDYNYEILMKSIIKNVKNSDIIQSLIVKKYCSTEINLKCNEVPITMKSLYSIREKNSIIY